MLVLKTINTICSKCTIIKVKNLLHVDDYIRGVIVDENEDTLILI